MELHAVAGIGLVGAIGIHGVPVLHAAQRAGQLDAHLGESVAEHVLKSAHDIVLLDKAHLDVHLGELGLAVGTQVLVTEALGNLVVALHAADHKKLFEQLRALGQRVEVTGLDAAGNQEVASALGRGLEQRRGLDLHEGALVQGLADGEGEVGAHLEVGHHLGTTDIQIAVAQADVFTGLDVVLDLEGRGLGSVKHLDMRDQHLDLARSELGVGLALGALAHHTGNLDGPLGTDGLGGVERGAAGMLGVEGDLRNALAVA